MSDRGKVLAVGPGLVNRNGVTVPVAVQPGDVVLFSMEGAAQVFVGRKRVLVLRESGVLAIEE
jgi:co-chaperonin GroES (HSP10)